MNRSVIIVGAILAVATVAFFGWPKIATWLTVAEDELSERIDTALGEFRVREASISKGIEELDAALQNMLASEVETRTQAQQISDRLGRLDPRINNGKQALRALRDALASGDSVELGGKHYSSEQEKDELAQKLLPRVEALEQQRAAYAEVHETLSQQVEFLQRTRSDGLQRVEEMREQLELFRAKVASLRTLKETTRIAGADRGGLGSRFESLQTEIDQTLAKLAGETAVEKDKLQNVLGEAAEEVQSILDDSATDDLVSRIDALLGE